jgi:hypothetical protein
MGLGGIVGDSLTCKDIWWMANRGHTSRVSNQLLKRKCTNIAKLIL